MADTVGRFLCPVWKDSRIQVVLWKEHRTESSRGCVLSREEQVMALLWASAHLSIP